MTPPDLERPDAEPGQLGPRLAAYALTAVVALLVFLGAWTLLPQSGSKHNGIGYRSHCPFAPVSTTMLLIPAAYFWSLRSKLGGPARH